MASNTQNADLVATIGVDVEGLLAGLRAGTLSVQGFAQQTQASAQLAEEALQGVGGSALSASQRMMQMRSGLSAARDGLLGVTIGGQGADRAFLAMGHHFTSLINETGSVTGAFSALGTSLMGAGGVILGLTVLYEIYKHVSDSSKEVTKAQKAYIDTLDSVTQAQLKGQQAGADETTRLQILYNATQNHSLSLKQRNAAYDELSDKYPKFFSNGDRENTLLGKNTEAYISLTNAILAAAMAKAAEDKISSNAARDLENQQKILDLTVKESKARADLARQTAILKQVQDDGALNGGATVGGTVNAAAGNQSLVNQAQNKLNELIKQKNDLLTDSGKLALQNTLLSQQATSYEAAANFKTNGQLDDKNKKLKQQKDALAQLEAQLKKDEGALQNSIIAGTTDANDFDSPLVRKVNADKEAIDNLKASLSGLQGGLKASGVNTVGVQNMNSIGDQLDTAPAKAQPDFAKAKTDLQEYINLKKTDLSALHAQSEAYKELSVTIGSGLTQAVFAAISGTQSLGSALASFLLQMAEKFAAAAAEALIFGAILDATGLGAILGISSSFSSLFSSFSGLPSTGSIPGHASGGITNGAHLAMVGEGREREAILPLSKLNQFVSSNGGGGNVQVQGKISGTTIRLQQIRQDKRTNRLT